MICDIQRDLFTAMDTNAVFRPSEYTFAVGRIITRAVNENQEFPWEEINELEHLSENLPAGLLTKPKLSSASDSRDANRIKADGKVQDVHEGRMGQLKQDTEDGERGTPVVKGKGRKGGLIKQEPSDCSEVRSATLSLLYNTLNPPAFITGKDQMLLNSSSTFPTKIPGGPKGSCTSRVI